ncbi:hypothetical protein QFC21_002744 [Naganishia friedmannii]|uniref:Uncharacterized protein n=1 Tax=Naganishia friedmannii TaxID=89922 RepID=A0ACC2VTM1_9TREE|nr:hypothetical protein QFC21_002744 [Naganishia friedmannii]
MPDYPDVAAYKIGQMQVKYPNQNAGMALAFVLSFDNNITAYKGASGSGCERVSISPDSTSPMLSTNVNTTNFRREENAGAQSSSVTQSHLSDYTVGLYNAISWDALPHDEPLVILWPYLNEMRYFSQCTAPSCTTPEANLALYKDALGFDEEKVKSTGKEMVMETVKDQNWTPEELGARLGSCSETPVFFTDNTKTEKPAWIVSSYVKETNDWRMDLVTSADEQRQSVVYTVEDIIAKVLPDYPDMVYVKARNPA